MTVLRPAVPGDAVGLSALALRSKAHWGYDAQFLALAAPALAVDSATIADRRTTVAVRDGEIVGFTTLDGSPPAGSLGNLWVDPPAIGSGVGRLLFADVLTRAAALGFTSLTIDADPNAEPFYLRMGAVRIGSAESETIPGRMLPLLRVTVTPA